MARMSILTLITSSDARYDDVRIACKCPHSGKLRYRAQSRLGMRITHLRFRCVL
jgi:hypothetical protein